MPSRPWSQIATNHKLRRQGFLNCRNLWLLQFVTVQNTTSQNDINCTGGYTPKYGKHVYIRIGQFQEGFLFALFMDLITDLHRNRYTIQKYFSYSCQKWTWVLSQVPRTRFQCYWNQYATLRHWSQIATNHKLKRQGVPNCRNLWLSQFVTVQNTTSQIDFIVTEGILLSAENMFTSWSDPFKKVSWVHRLWAL